VTVGFTEMSTRAARRNTLEDAVTAKMCRQQMGTGLQRENKQVSDIYM